jgi:hypothetical protein
MATLDFSIAQYGTVGPLNGKLSRGQVREILGDGFDVFWKTTNSLNTTDAYIQFDLHVYYDERDVVKGVEFFERSKVSWSGHKLVGETSSDVLALFRRNGIDPVVDDDGFEVGELGMGFYVDGDDGLITALYIDLRREALGG